jgi:hypothetical protein
MSPLIDTTPRYYAESPWVQSVQLFLQSINGKIYVPELSRLTKNRLNDRPIMNQVPSTFTNSDMECINACRIFLQVTYLSEISNDDGNKILQEAVKGTVDQTRAPTLWTLSQSKLTWPRQPRPSTTSWNKWKKYLQAITNPMLQIQPSLGNWTSDAHQQRQWHFTRHKKIMYVTSTKENTTFVESTSHTRRRTYLKDINHPPIQWNTSFIPTIPNQITNEKITCSNI